MVLKKTVWYLPGIMPTPEQQRLYDLLSGQLQTIALHYRNELPSGSTSVLMKVQDGQVLVEAYDFHGKKIGTIPNEKTSPAFRADLNAAFLRSASPDPDGVVAIISSPTMTAS